MDYLILFNGKEYYINKRYLFNKETDEIYSLYWKRNLSPFYSNDISKQKYVSLNSNTYNYEQIVKWNHEDIDRTKLKNCYEVKKICKKCKEEGKTYTSKKVVICNDCIMSMKSSVITKKLSNEDDFITADKFLHKLKAKKWMATPLDLYELIDIYERYYPNMMLGQPLTEEYATKILMRIVKHHKKLKSEAIKKYMKD